LTFRSEGFDLHCADIVWHCSFNSLTDSIEITENGQKRPAIWRINYAAKTAAERLITGPVINDIHTEKLMRMPEDHS